MNRLAICAVISLIAHLAFERGLELLPPDRARAAPPPTTIEIRVIPPPAPPVPEIVPPPVAEPVAATPPAAAPEPAPTPHPSPAPAPRPAPRIAPAVPAAAAPATEATAPPAEQIFNGGDLGSTSSVGSGPAGSTGTGAGRGSGSGSGASGAGTTPAPRAAPGAGPIGAYAATKMPLPQGRCTGKYTPAATAAGTEGTVVLDLTVGEDGRARDIVATAALPNGLTESAVAALRDCQFSPGEQDGRAVAVRIRGFKIHFMLQEAQP